MVGDGGVPCLMCGEALDPFGDHLLCCKKNKLVQHHNTVRDALAMVLREKGVHCKTEVTIGGKMRPADIAFEGVDPAGPLAVDLVVFHPLQKSLVWEEEACVKSMASKEHQKITKNQPICEAAGWLFSPLSFHPWAGLGPLGSGLLSRLMKQALGDKQGWARQHMEADIWHRLSATLMSFIAEQLSLVLSVASQDRLPTLVQPPAQTTQSAARAAVHAVAPLDMDGWHASRTEGTFVGPIRIQCTRPQM